MKEKDRALLESYLDGIREEFRSMFWELAQYADALGYRPVRNKTKEMSLDFRKSSCRATIMKMAEHESGHGSYGYGERDRPELRLKFYASREYSQIFREGIRTVIENFNGRYTGCYGCGRCKGEPQGYVYIYPDGRRVFRCGSELISIFDYSAEDLPEIKNLLRAQDEYFVRLSKEGL